MSLSLDRAVRLRALAISFSTAAIAALSACGGGGSGSPAPAPVPAPPAPTYAVTVNVAGLASEGLALANGGSTVVASAGDTSLTFPDRIAEGGAYAVTIAAQPSSRAQTCTVANGSGTVAGADVVVAVECHATTWVLSGITGGATIAKPYVDGPVAVATFNNPWGLVYDAAGNLYVADDIDFVVRKITPDGIVSTYAGSGVTDADGNSSLVDGPAATATFWDPRGLAFGPDGALYVADGLAIRRIGSDGMVTTVAGSATEYGYVDGPAATARFSQVTGLRFAADGTLYLADHGNYAIRKLGLDGTVSTIAGNGSRGWADGTGADAGFTSPFSLAIAPGGDLYVTDDFTLRRVTPAGVVTTLAGSEDASCLFDGAGHISGNPLCGASGIEVDAAGNAFVADTGGNRVQMFAPDGTVTTLIFANSTFFPYGIAMAPDGSFTLADDAQGDNPRIARLAPQ